MGRVQHIQSVPVAPAAHSSLTPLHTYATLGQPVSASQQAALTSQQSRRALQQFAQLNTKQSRHGRVVSTQMPDSTSSTRSALGLYARLGRQS